MTTFWFETEAGAVERVPATDEEAALELARARYPNSESGPDDLEMPVWWLVRKGSDGEEDDFLVPGGPDNEEFTWMPRSLWRDWPDMMDEALKA